MDGKIVYMMPQSYLLRTLRLYSQPQINIENFLTEQEMALYTNLRFEKRQQDWLLGRLTLKELLRKKLQLQYDTTFSWKDIQVLKDTDGRPIVSYLINNSKKFYQGCVSISHCNGVAFCSAICDPNISLGVDLEKIAERPRLFAETFYTQKELQYLEQTSQKDMGITVIWAAKEAILKILGVGLQRDTKTIEVLPQKNLTKNWNKISAHIPGTNAVVSIWVRCMGCYVLAWAVMNKHRADKGK